MMSWLEYEFAAPIGQHMTGVFTPEAGESVIANTSFGTVTNRRVRYHFRKGWISSGTEEDLPLRHITSVRLETSRHPIWGIILVVVGLALLKAVAILAIVALIVAGLLLWGSPKVVVNTAGGDLRPATGFPWTRKEAARFVEALRDQLFKE